MIHKSKIMLMGLHVASIRWTCEGDFAKGQYARSHLMKFDGGATVTAAASPANVPGPYTDASAIDPEEALVAAVASCHMLWFLDLARRAGLVVDSYSDDAKGHLTGGSKPFIDRIDLYPRTTWAGDCPDPSTISDLHHAAHENCFIANSVRAEIVVN